MRQNPNYIRITLSKNTYLCPVAQSISDLKRAIRINDTGAYLWDLLGTEHTPDELINEAAAHFDIPADQTDSFKNDIITFLNTLNLQGAILAPLAVPKGSSGYYHTLGIAGLSVNLYGEADVFAEEFAPFYEEYTENADMTALVVYGMPVARENGSLLIRNKELTILEAPDKYILLFHQESRVGELHLSKDASLAVFYCNSGESLKEDLFHALRFAFLYLAQRHGIFAIHSASILYREKAWLFSAPSGTGKSTHAALWHEILGTPYINGDLNLITLKKDGAYVFGLPWCGTSGITDTASYPLSGIIFLKKSSKDTVVTLDPDERVLALSRRLISPCWDAEMLQRQLKLGKDISDRIFMCRLLCTKEPSALYAIRTAVDKFLQ